MGSLSLLRALTLLRFVDLFVSRGVHALLVALFGVILAAVLVLVVARGRGVGLAVVLEIARFVVVLVLVAEFVCLVVVQCARGTVRCSRSCDLW